MNIESLLLIGPSGTWNCSYLLWWDVPGTELLFVGSAAYCISVDGEFYILSETVLLVWLSASSSVLGGTVLPPRVGVFCVVVRNCQPGGGFSSSVFCLSRTVSLVGLLSCVVLWGTIVEFLLRVVLWGAVCIKLFWNCPPCGRCYRELVTLISSSSSSISDSSDGAARTSWYQRFVNCRIWVCPSRTSWWTQEQHSEHSKRTRGRQGWWKRERGARAWPSCTSWKQTQCSQDLRTVNVCQHEQKERQSESERVCVCSCCTQRDPQERNDSTVNIVNSS